MVQTTNQGKKIKSAPVKIAHNSNFSKLYNIEAYADMVFLENNTEQSIIKMTIMYYSFLRDYRFKEINAEEVETFENALSSYKSYLSGCDKELLGNNVDYEGFVKEAQEKLNTYKAVLVQSEGQPGSV